MLNSGRFINGFSIQPDPETRPRRFGNDKPTLIFESTKFAGMGGNVGPEWIPQGRGHQPPASLVCQRKDRFNIDGYIL